MMSSSMMITLLVHGLLLACSLHASAAADIGTCYGTLGDNLPSPTQIVALYKQYNIARMRIYSPVPGLSSALQGSGIQVMVGVPNNDLQSIASSQANANSWVQNNILAYRDVNWKYIAVGNEVRPNNGESGLAQYVLPAMKNIQNAVNQFGLSQLIKVSTAWEMGVLTDTFPPSQGQFDPSIGGYTLPIVQFLMSNGSPLLLNCYPYFAYTSNPQAIDLNYALFTSPGVVAQDGPNGYQNLLFAMVDSAYAALEKVGAGGVRIVVSETGWPTAGGVANSIGNAQTYNNNLIQKVKQGTPGRSGQPIEAYIFDMVDEDSKTPEFEKHWGLFTGTTLKYPVNFN
ncbi:hypothetical protein Dimus_031467 [Dionaea muscipula]